MSFHMTSSGMSAARILATCSLVSFTSRYPHRHRWKPNPHAGCHVGKPTSAPYCSMTCCGLGPEKKYRSSVPPMRRYSISETGDAGGVRSRMSEPAALLVR